MARRVDDAPAYLQAARERRGSDPWVRGLATFAGIMMIITGLFHALAGLVGIVWGEFYAVTPNYVFAYNVGGWGWVHLILGILIAVAGFAVMSGQLWARIVGITLAALSAIANFLFIPYYPLWSILIIAIDVLVIWALASYDRRAAVS